MKLNSTFLISALAGIDLASADGRAGIASLLSEIERRDPGAILRSAARVQGRQLREGGIEGVRVEPRSRYPDKNLPEQDYRFNQSQSGITTASSERRALEDFFRTTDHRRRSKMRGPS